ncbi:hypothetical protein J6590_052664 [Homalodisca vitripennis]|nr:hypothetical protein J6590_052664 [Homalodisca vitripennis]
MPARQVIHLGSTLGRILGPNISNISQGKASLLIGGLFSYSPEENISPVFLTPPTENFWVRQYEHPYCMEPDMVNIIEHQ